MPDDALDRLRELVAKLVHPTILVIEDDRDDRELLTHALEENQHKVKFVETGESALREISYGFVSLVILDLKLPDVPEPVAFIKQIKSLRREMPIVVLTGQTVTQQLRDILKDFTVAVLMKPLSREQIKSVFSSTAP